MCQKYKQYLKLVLRMLFVFFAAVRLKCNTFEMAVPMECSEIRMYGNNDELLKTKEIFRGTEEVTLQEETAYVIVEEVKTDGLRQKPLLSEKIDTRIG